MTTLIPVEVIAEALTKHDGHGDNAFDDFYACSCGEWDMDTVVYDERKAAHVAHQAAVIAALPDIAIVQVPSVRYKAQGETDAQRYEQIAGRVERDHYVGGSNSRAAVAELLRRVAGSLAAGGES